MSQYETPTIVAESQYTITMDGTNACGGGSNNCNA